MLDIPQCKGAHPCKHVTAKPHSSQISRRRRQNCGSARAQGLTCHFSRCCRRKQTHDKSCGGWRITPWLLPRVRRAGHEAGGATIQEVRRAMRGVVSLCQKNESVGMLQGHSVVFAYLLRPRLQFPLHTEPAWAGIAESSSHGSDRNMDESKKPADEGIGSAVSSDARGVGRGSWSLFFIFYFDADEFTPQINAPTKSVAQNAASVCDFSTVPAGIYRSN